MERVFPRGSRKPLAGLLGGRNPYQKLRYIRRSSSRKIIPIDLTKEEQLICQKGAFLSSFGEVDISIQFQKKSMVGFFGGEGFILQKITGNTLAFIHASGYIVEKELNGDKVLVDTSCLVGFTGDISYDIQKAGSVKSMIFGGEGLFFAALSGYGKVYIQSMPFSRLANTVIKHTSIIDPKNTKEK